ncbi:MULTISPECIES: acyl-CoA dehydratase activase [Calditerrivibrio]|jgi:predicted CoA-substrate-specific enzyme activase|uniref:CoA activase n=1 Tax=Calditerrivibrio nitroreducens TaxID=477976 RepID=A0A2J6WMC9_9BACT|nr:MAG: CoA activase [Calditerrivibrio nitroreducens]
MYAGIDLGSRFVKIAMLFDGKVEYRLYDTVEFYRKYVKRIDGELLIDPSFLPEMPERIVATGYGRNLLNFKNVEVISEIKAHYRGALEQIDLDNFVLIDIGGQDSKVIVVRDRYIEDFVMNDKCAASSGRFIETAADILKTPVEEFGRCYENAAKLSSTCSVFAESEIISKIAEGYSLESIAAGVNDSIARRILPLVKKYTKHSIYASGGVVRLSGVLHFLSIHLSKKVDVLKNPHYNGAIGCLAYSVGQSLKAFHL